MNTAEARDVLVPQSEHAALFESERIRHLSAATWIGDIVLRLADLLGEDAATQDGCGVRILRLDTPTHAGEELLAVHRAGCPKYAAIEAAHQADSDEAAHEAEAIARYGAGKVNS